MNTNAINVQQKITFGWVKIESVPSKDWRTALANGEPVTYRHEITGNAKVLCNDGNVRVVNIDLTVFGKKRRSNLGGIVEKWAPRPSRGEDHAQCKVRRDGDNLVFDGPITFTEPDILDPAGQPQSPEAGLVLVAQLVKGKTFAVTGAEMRPRLHRDGQFKGQPVIGADGSEYLEIRHLEGLEVVDRPQIALLGDDDAEAEASSEVASTRAAARKTSKAVAADDAVEGAL